MNQPSRKDMRRGLDPDALERDFLDHLTYTLVKELGNADRHDCYQALAHGVRDRLIDRWIETKRAHREAKSKRVYYLSLEFLMGRILRNNIANLEIETQSRQALASLGLDLDKLEEEEADMGLGNGGLGRLAACFIDSLATLQIPAIGYGLRYQYGIFRQEIENGYQEEHPDEWLKWGNPWEIPRPDLQYEVHFGGKVESWLDGAIQRYRWVGTQLVIGIPYDVPITGYGGHTVNTLRLWSAHATEDFDFEDFNKGDYIAAVENKVKAENLTKVLYPNDHHSNGKELRLRQQYFFVSCSLQDLIARFKAESGDWTALPEHAAIQLNDTHPSLAVPELMRLLVDIEGLEWETAWTISRACLGYTNHTLMPEAMEKWPVAMMEGMLPRHLQIIYDINQRFLNEITERFRGDTARLTRMSIIEEGQAKQVRMSHLAIVGSHATNGVAKIHTQLLKSRVVPDFAEMFPERFSAKTNGITQRRWLLQANPALAQLITATIGDGWIKDLSQLARLKPHAEDGEFRAAFRAVKAQAKTALSAYIAATWGWQVDPDSIFDIHIKRLHEYKRQLMNAIHIVILYDHLRRFPHSDWHPRVFFFAGKAAPGYFMAKLIIKLIHDIAETIQGDARVNKKLQVLFLPNYGVSLAERLIPAADLSEQISTAGTEASGTGNMKFMLNGALTIGTLDGANLEIAEEVGREQMFIFGLNAAEAEELRPTYKPKDYYRRHRGVRRALELIFSGFFNSEQPELYHPIRDALLEHGDPYLVLADLPAYTQAHVQALSAYSDKEAWARAAILNIAASGKFSSDRTITEYANDIWHISPSPMP